MRKLPSTWSIVGTDNVCFRIVTFAPVVFFMALVIKLTGTVPGGRGKPDTPLDPEVATMVLACAVALVLFLSAIAAMRIARVRSLFETGREVEATVRKVKRFRGGMTLKLELTLSGIAYDVRSTFLYTSRTPEFVEGTRIPMLVDPGNPKRAVPLALYADSGAVHRGERPRSAEDHSWDQKSNISGLRLRSGASRRH